MLEAYEERLSIQKGMIFPKSDAEWKKVQEEEWTEEWEHVTGDLNYRQLFVQLEQGGEVTVRNPKSQGQKLTHEIADAADGRCNQTNRNGSIEAQN